MPEPPKLLLTLLFNDLLADGFQTLKRLLVCSSNVELIIFGDWKRLRRTGENALKSLDSQFNIAEGIAEVAGSQTARPTTICFRYRPAPSSRVWRRIGIPGSEHEQAGESLQTTKLLMSQVSLEQSNRSPEAKSSGVIQFLLQVQPVAAGWPTAIHKTIAQLVPNLLEKGLWGVANVVPFRRLSVDEEWKIARTGMLRAEPSTFFQDQWNQFLVCAADAARAFPHTSVLKIGDFSIYELEKPAWANTDQV